jgi:ribosomal protein S18 acetylase RimI-like enzyme
MAVAIRAIDPLPHREALHAVYCAALGKDPDAARNWVDDILPRHARQADFAFRAAVDDDGEIIGFAYGYTGAYGQWWTDRVAVDMSDEARREWLDPPHFEVCELMVRPRAQRRGLGTRLLDAVLAAQPNDRALLSADPTSPTAAPFYRKHGWEVVSVWHWQTGDKLVLGRMVGR